MRRRLGRPMRRRCTLLMRCRLMLRCLMPRRHTEQEQAQAPAHRHTQRDRLMQRQLRLTQLMRLWPMRRWASAVFRVQVGLATAG